MNQCTKCDLVTSEELPIMFGIGLGICKDCNDSMSQQERDYRLSNFLDNGPYKL